MEEWKSVHIGDLGTIVTGKTPKTSIEDNYGGDTPFLSPSDDLSGKYVPITGRTLSNKGVSEVKNCLLPPQSVCVSCIGSDLGKSVITRCNTITNQQFNSIIPSNGFDTDFVYYAMQFVGPILNALSKTSTAVPIINKSTFSSFQIRVPDYSTQCRISRVLSALDDKIELNHRINHNLEEQAQIVFDRIFNSDLTNNCLLSSIVDINPKRTLRKNEVARCIDMTYLNTAGSFPSGWEFKPYSGGMKFINGDTLMARITPCLENGKVAYINFLDKEETAFGSTEYIVFHAKEGYPNEMFYFLTRNKAFIEFATKNMNGSSGRQRVSGETIGNYIIPVLSEDDINELKTVSESTMKEILKNNLESRVLSEMRNTILPKLMSGELKINDLTC